MDARLEPVDKLMRDLDYELVRGRDIKRYLAAAIAEATTTLDTQDGTGTLDDDDPAELYWMAACAIVRAAQLETDTQP